MLQVGHRRAMETSSPAIKTSSISFVKGWHIFLGLRDYRPIS
jgi:hypothetical protein